MLPDTLSSSRNSTKRGSGTTRRWDLPRNTMGKCPGDRLPESCRGKGLHRSREIPLSESQMYGRKNNFINQSKNRHEKSLANRGETPDLRVDNPYNHLIRFNIRNSRAAFAQLPEKHLIHKEPLYLVWISGRSRARRIPENIPYWQAIQNTCRSPVWIRFSPAIERELTDAF